MEYSSRPVALVTGGSRGIGAACALALAERGCDVVITYRNKATRASEVRAELEQRGARALSIGSDITRQEDREKLLAALSAWSNTLNILVLNASGGLERDTLAIDPEYPMHINRDAQLALVDLMLPRMPIGSSIIFVTSHWAHLYGQVAHIPVYAPVAESKHAGEQALRARQETLADRGIRLIVVTGDLIEGTITPKLLERATPGLAEYRRMTVGQLPSAADMGEAIATAALDDAVVTGSTIVVGGSLDSLPRGE